ncbi:MAG TPA: magnesium transporter CorA family protein, partial [Opitutus sp.]|nr:magnesium transporter CorA family protein [Opitutus sp.]
TPDEIKRVETLLGIELPTRNETQEIEVSSRLYTENRTLFMTATIMVRADKPDLTTAAVTFIYRSQQLVTLRFDSPMPFRTFAARFERNRPTYDTAQKVLLGLFDEVVDRVADILEFVAADLNDLSTTIFMEEPHETGTLNYTNLLARIGRNGARTANARESLVSLRRLHGFFTEMCSSQQGEELEENWRIAGKDVTALADHATFISSKVNFFLDATLGRVNSEQNTINSQQNKIIKLFSVLAVVLLPPTLIASIYGMNFEFIPELKWKWGYPFSLVLMLISAIVPYLIFRYKRWL